MGASGRLAIAALAALLAAAGLALCVPGAALAKANETDISPQFTIEGKQGLELRVSGSGGSVYASIQKSVREPKDPRELTFGLLSNDYFSHGHATRTRLEADFGRFGKVDLKFKPTGKPRAFGSSAQPTIAGRAQVCGGNDPVEQPGYFQGTVSFTGDDHFVAFHAKRVKGMILELSEVECSARPLAIQIVTGSFGGEDAPKALLEATTPSGDLTFAALGYASPGHPTFLASEARHFGRLTELRTATSFFDPGVGAFEYDEPLDSATVRPSAPFEGEATFRREASGATTWSGTLMAPLLGGSVALAGSPIEAVLARPKVRGHASR